MGITLALLREADISIVLKWNKNKNRDFLYSWAGKGYSFPLTREQVHAKIMSLNELAGTGCTGENYNWHSPELKQIIFKIIHRATGRMIGTVELSGINRKNKNAFVSRFLIGEESNRNKGYGSMALKEVVHFAKTKLNIKKLFLRVFDFNKNAIRCYEKAGFAKVKYKKNVWQAENGFWNTYTMKLVIQ